MRKTLTLCLLLVASPLLFAQDTVSAFSNNVNRFFEPIVSFLDKILFWDPFAALGFELGIKIPFIIIWLIFGALFFTIYFRFINY